MSPNADGPLWTPPPDRVSRSAVAAFAEQAGRELDYPALHRWSVDEPEEFWIAAWEFLAPSVAADGPSVLDPDELLGATWFPGVRLNVAERILAGDTAGSSRPDDEEMLVALDERGRRRSLTRAEARGEVAAVAAALRDQGVGPGDRVAVWLPNSLEAVLVMLGAASIGAVFSSCSPDFGADGVLDRFGQIRPNVLVAADGYSYGGRDLDRRSELATLFEDVDDDHPLASVRQVVVVGFLRDDPDVDGLRLGVGERLRPVDWRDWLQPHRGAAPAYEQLPFDHPWYVLFSSGTTGAPKCIVHRSGGVLLQHLKEHRLQLDVGPGDRVAYFTTCGWMMWNWLASVPASGATAVLYDGNPFHPGPEVLWDLAGGERLALLGVSAKYLEALEQSGYRPGDRTDLATLRTLCSTGSPLSPESFRWVTEHVAPAVGADGLHLASISGGTDLCGCFVCGDPTGPVWPGEIQRPALGMAVDVVDGSATGPGAVSLPAGERGELVCRAPFPSMPLGFWGDGPLGEVGPRYRAAYFERIDGLWAQGDFATWTVHGGMVIHGRSDTTLNPGGVRIGTAEIYRQVERVPEVVESLVVGQPVDNDVRIVLLVRIAEGATLDAALCAAIRDRVRRGCSPRHVPGLIVEVGDLPRTRSGKLAELAVADRLAGRPVRNTTALANPEALDEIAAAVADADG